MTYVVVDWRPYDLPEVYGPFGSEDEADDYARRTFEVDTDELPDGIIVRTLQEGHVIKSFVDCRSVYLGGPISLGGTLLPSQIEANLLRFYEVETKLQRLGLAVFNPARLPKHNRQGERSSQEDYLEQCVWMVMQSDGVVVLDGWEESAGTTREVLIAQSTGKPVFAETLAPIEFEVVTVVRELAQA